MTVYSETWRKSLHIAMAGFALLLRYLTWAEAAGLAAAAIGFNAFVLHRIAPRIVRKTDWHLARAGLLFYPISILVLILAFPRRLDIVAAGWGVLAFGDGFATLTGATLGGPRLPWNPRKTWVGLMAFMIMGALGAVGLCVWVAPAISPQPSMMFTVWAPIAAAVVAGMVETVPVGLDDNITVPAAAAGVLWFSSQLNWTGPDTLVVDFLTGVIVSLPLALAARKIGRMTTAAALTGSVFAGVIYAAVFLAGLVVLAVALTLTILSSRLGRARRNALRIAEEKSGRRGVANIVANCLVGTLGALLELFTFDWGVELAGVWIVAGIAAGASDTVASEVGKAWASTPRSFPTGRKVPPGTPGGVSVAGTLAGLLAAAVIAAPAAFMWLIPWELIAPIVIACTCGAFLESALATSFEGRGLIENNTLNFLNTAVAAALAVWWCSRVMEYGRVL